MTEFWESSFIEKQTMWGFELSVSAILMKDFFLEKNVKDIFNYKACLGRNVLNNYINDKLVSGTGPSFRF